MALIRTFVPSEERHVVPPEPEHIPKEVSGKGGNWKFIERKPNSGPLIDFSELFAGGFFYGSL